MLLPLVYLVVRTVGAGAEVIELLLRLRTLAVAGRTMLLILGVVGACMLLSVPLAWLTARTDLPLRRFWTVATALPLVMPSYVVGLTVLAALGPKGLLQRLLERLIGVDRLPEIYGFPGALLTIVLISYPLTTLTIRAALQRMDRRLEEVSYNLGRSRWRTFLRITLPQLRPSIASGTLLVALYTLRDFGAVSLLRYETFTWAIYLQYQTSFNRSVAAGLSLVVLAVAVCFLFLESRTRSPSSYYRGGAGAPRAASTVHLGKWKWPALIFCTGLVFCSLILPLSVLIYWLVLGAMRGETLGLVWGPALNSIFVSVLAALAVGLLSFPVAFVTVRSPGWLAGIAEKSTYIGYTLPGIVVALGLAFFGANFLPMVYQSLGLLLFAYVILFLPLSLGAVRSSLMQVNPNLEEAARSLGRSPLRVLRSVTLPLVRPGVLAGSSLVFFTAMKELPATLILSPIGFKTLAVSIWSAATEAFFARAAAPALLLILVSAIPITLFTLREERA